MCVQVILHSFIYIDLRVCFEMLLFFHSCFILVNWYQLFVFVIFALIKTCMDSVFISHLFWIRHGEQLILPFLVAWLHFARDVLYASIVDALTTAMWSYPSQNHGKPHYVYIKFMLFVLSETTYLAYIPVSLNIFLAIQSIALKIFDFSLYFEKTSYVG